MTTGLSLIVVGVIVCLVAIMLTYYLAYQISENEGDDHNHRAKWCYMPWPMFAFGACLILVGIIMSISTPFLH